MQSHWVNGAPYYRCRFPAECALADRVQHPLNVHLREDAVLGRIDKWLAREFTPHRLAETLRALAEARPIPASAATGDDIASKIAECDRKLARYRAILDAGANSATVADWIAESEPEKATYALAAREPRPPRRMTEQEINTIVEKFADIARVLTDADPDDKAEIFRKLGLELTCPGRQLVKAQIEASQHWQMESVRGVIAPKSYTGQRS